MAIGVQTLVRDCADERLTGARKAALLELAEHADEGGRNARPGTARIASRTGLSEKTVRRALRDLERWGFIHCVREHAQHSTKEYQLDLDMLRVVSVTGLSDAPRVDSVSAQSGHCVPQTGQAVPQTGHSDQESVRTVEPSCSLLALQASERDKTGTVMVNRPVRARARCLAVRLGWRWPPAGRRGRTGKASRIGWRSG